MPAIQLFGLGIAAKSPTVTAKLMTNFYAETRPAGEKSVLVAHGTPGLELFCDLDAPARGALEFEKNSVAYVVAGDTLWEIDGNGVKTNRGTLLTTTSRVSMAHNGVQVMMVDGAHGYIYNTVTLAFAQITDTDFPLNPTTVTYLSRRFICSFLDSSRFYVSAIDDGLLWDALDFANAEANPDPIIAVWASTGQLCLLGAVTTEFWGNSGALDFPFTALQGAANEWGLAALSSIAKYDNTFACLIKNRMGQVMVAQMAGYLPKKISTIDIDHIINSYVANEDAVGYSYMLGGHPFYVICFPSAAVDNTASQGEAPEADAAAREVCVPVPPDPIPDRYLYLGPALTAGVLSTQSAETKWIWTLDNTENFGADVTVTVTSDVGVQEIVTLTTSVLNPDATGAKPMMICDVPSVNEVWVVVQRWPTADRRPKILRYSAGTAAVDGTATVAPAFIAAHSFTDTTALDPSYIGYDATTDKVWLICTQSNAAPVQVCIISPATLAVDVTVSTGIAVGFPQQLIFAAPYVMLSGWGGPVVDGEVVSFMMFQSAAPYALGYTLTLDIGIGGGKPIDYDSVRSRFIAQAESGLVYYLIDAATGSVVTQAFAHAAGADTVPPPITGALITGVTYYARLDKYIFVQQGGPAEGTSLTIVNPITLASESTYTYELGSGLLARPVYEPQTGGNYILVFDSTHVKRYYFGEVCPTVPVPEPEPVPDADDDFAEDHVAYAGGEPFDGRTWLYDGATGFWSMLKSAEISRHRVQHSYQCAGQTIGSDYFNGKQYRITDTAYSDNGRMIEGEIIGETIALPDQAFLTVNKLRVGMETGVSNTVAPGENAQVALSVARDSGAKQYGPEMWKPLGMTGDFFARLEWRRLGTTRYFTAKLRVTDAIKRVITGASINAPD